MCHCPMRWNHEKKQGPPEDEWVVRGGDKYPRCSYCGSNRPDDFLALVKQGRVLEPTDKNYKAYVLGENGRRSSELHFAHLEVEQARLLIELERTKRINFAFPGHFYVRPFFMAAEDAAPFSISAIVKFEGTVADGQLISFIEPAYFQLLKELQKNPHVMHEIDPRKWEEIVAAAYDEAGFDEVILTPRSGDLGRVEAIV
jgi:hypothetical protein